MKEKNGAQHSIALNGLDVDASQPNNAERAKMKREMNISVFKLFRI